MIASSYPQLGWLAPRGAITAPKTRDMVAPTASAAPVPDQHQLAEVLRDVHAMRQSIDRIAASQDQITRSIDQIAPGEEPTRSTDEIASRTAQAPAADATRITVESGPGVVAAGAFRHKAEPGETATDSGGKRQAVICREQP
jgi:hypothetical protein